MPLGTVFRPHDHAAFHGPIAFALAFMFALVSSPGSNESTAVHIIRWQGVAHENDFSELAHAQLGCRMGRASGSQGRCRSAAFNSDMRRSIIRGSLAKEVKPKRS